MTLFFGITIDAGGCTDRAVWGGLLQRCAEVRGVAGVIVDGVVRDSRELQCSPVAIYALGLCPIKPQKKQLGSIADPTSIGGIAVYAGDVVRGDSDGVIVIPACKLEHADSLCIKRFEEEKAIRRFIELNHCTPRSTVGASISRQ